MYDPAVDDASHDGSPPPRRGPQTDHVFVPDEAAVHAKTIADAKAGRIVCDPAFGLWPDPDTHGGRCAAYRALGLPLAPVPEALGTRAYELSRLLDFVGGSNEAPAAMIDVAEHVVTEWLRSHRQAKPWMFTLAAILQPPRPTFGTADDVLSSLVASAPDVPAMLRNPRAGALEEARRVVRRWQESRALGRPKTGWARAVEFARAFGLTTLPARRGWAERQAQTVRKRARTEG